MNKPSKTTEVAAKNLKIGMGTEHFEILDVDANQMPGYIRVQIRTHRNMTCARYFRPESTMAVDL